MVLLSAVKPDAGFRAGVAMARNRLIYGQSSGTVVIRSDLNKGGTWSGAVECLRHQWCPVFCQNKPDYPGNTALIAKGAIPVDGGWDGNVLAPPFQEEQGKKIEKAEKSENIQTEAEGEQITLFA